MKILKIILTSFIFCVQSCNQYKNDQNVVNSDVVNEKSSTLTQNSCKDRVKKFLTWYLANGESIDSLNSFINYPASIIESFKLNKDNISKSGYYELNKTKASDYINELSESGFFSNKFLLDKKTNILSREGALLAAKQDDGPPEGFDFDEIFVTQEMYESEHIQNLKAMPSIKGAYILPVMEDYGWILYTKSENGTCVIDSISRLNAD